MPRRKSLTRRFVQHLLLISLARTILTAIGRGRSWDEWDEGKLVEAAQPRKSQLRFAKTLSFSALFFDRFGTHLVVDDGGLDDRGASVVSR